MPPGKTITLGDAKGPGVINHIWMTLGGAADYRSVILRVYWDGETTPSVEVPAGDVFAAGWGRGAEPVINSATAAVNPGSGFNSFWQMLRSAAGAPDAGELSATRALTIYYAIELSRRRRSRPRAGYFHAQFRMGKADPATGDYTLLDGVKGQGQYVGTYLRHRAFSPGWWGEGEAKFYIDGDKGFPPPSRAPARRIISSAPIPTSGEQNAYVNASRSYLQPMRASRCRTRSTPTIPKPATAAMASTAGIVLDPIRFKSGLREAR